MLREISGTQGRYGADILDNAKNSKKANDLSKKIVVANKGETGYLHEMDIDYNGIVTLDEFNQYCEEKGVDGKEKMKLFQTIMLKGADEKSTEQNKKSSETEEKNNIYAQKGEDKYNEDMDINKDSIVTYDEYLKYCLKSEEQKERENKDTSTKSVSFEFKKAIEAYTTKESEAPFITVESIA